jgi:uncharacterized protein YecT (DUF1311 family)
MDKTLGRRELVTLGSKSFDKSWVVSGAMVMPMKKKVIKKQRSEEKVNTRASYSQIDTIDRSLNSAYQSMRQVLRFRPTFLLSFGS